jgi:hypothetical protein
MKGKFLGNDSNSHINHGVWIWAREAEQLLSLAEKMHHEGYDFQIAEVRRILNAEMRRIQGKE